MTASKPDTQVASPNPYGKTDFVKMDAHVIQPEEYEELPEITDEMLDRADFYIGDKLIRRGRGRPKLDNPKQQVTLRLDADVIEAMRASGPGWQTRANDVLRERFKAG